MSFVASSSALSVTESLDTREVLSREIPWQAYVTAKLISDKELKLIQKFDKQLPEVRNTLLEEDGLAYFDAFMNVLRTTTKEEVVQYVLAVVDEAIDEDPERACLLHQCSGNSETVVEPYSIFLHLLGRTDWFTQERACRLLTALIVSRGKKEFSPLTTGKDLPTTATTAAVDSTGTMMTAEMAVVQFFDWLTSQLRRPTSKSKSVPCAIHAVASLLRERGTRLLFHRLGGANLLAPSLKQVSPDKKINIQLIYEATLAVWLLSYLPETHKSIQDCDLARALVGILQLNVKEKVTRVALFALKNILASDKIDVTVEVVDAKLPRLVQIRTLQSWEDEDILSTLEWLNEKIRTGIQTLSSYDKYRQEVLSGKLEWGPIHTEEQFWKQNIERFDEKDFNILRVLLRLLEISREVKTLAVGCHDLGQFVTYHPHGRFIVSDLRGKEIVMELMRHTDPEVQKNALLCVQKLMLSRDKLDFLTGQA